MRKIQELLVKKSHADQSLRKVRDMSGKLGAICLALAFMSSSGSAEKAEPHIDAPSAQAASAFFEPDKEMVRISAVKNQPATQTGQAETKKPALDQILAKKGVKRGDPVFIRIFKRESQLELWMKRGPRYTLAKTFDICSWSGNLGPKLKEGDYQSPEGFYVISRKSLNPNSHYHLSFNIGYPNAYDRAHHRTGSYIMVHGSCVSIGCFAMTNEGIEEIYGLVKAAFDGGQRFVRVHIFPFRMTAANIDGALDEKWIDFWWNLKQGYDLFEARLLPPDVRVCNGAYVFTPTPFAAAGVPNWTRTCKK